MSCLSQPIPKKFFFFCLIKNLSIKLHQNITRVSYLKYSQHVDIVVSNMLYYFPNKIWLTKSDESSLGFSKPDKKINCSFPDRNIFMT